MGQGYFALARALASRTLSSLPGFVLTLLTSGRGLLTNSYQCTIVVADFVFSCYTTPVCYSDKCSFEVVLRLDV